MRAGHTYRHINTLDIDVECLAVTYTGSNYFKVKLRLFNRHNGAFYETNVFNINNEDRKKWKFII